MSGPAPQVAIEFTGNTDPVTLAVRELVSTLKGLDRTQGELTRSSNGLAAASERTASGFDNMAGLVRRLAASYVVLRAVDFVKDAIDSADAIGKLADKTGASTEALSVFAFAATTADASQEDLEKGLVKLSRTLDDANGGSKGAALSLARLGISAKEIKGLRVDDAFLRIANAIQALPAGYERAALAQQVFGKAGAQLIPLLLDLAGHGMADAEARARSLGLVLNRDATNAARDFNDNLTTLKNTARGAATDFATGLTPAILDVAHALTASATDAVGTGFFGQLGKLIGDLVKSTTEDAIRLEAVLETLVARMTLAAGNAKAVLLLASGDIEGATITHRLATVEFDGTIAGIRSRRTASLNRLNPAPPNETRDGLTDTANARADAAARGRATTDAAATAAGAEAAKAEAARRKAVLDGEKATIEQRLQLEQVGTKALEAANQLAYDRSLESLAAFYAARRQLQHAASAREIAALEAQRALVLKGDATTPAEVATRQNAANALAATIVVKRAEADQRDVQFVAEEATARTALETQQLDFEAKLREAKGESLAVALTSIDREATKYEQLLVRLARPVAVAPLGLALDPTAAAATAVATAAAAAARAGEVQAFRDALTLKAELADVQTRATAALADLSQARQAIANDVTTGVITEFQGQQQVAALETARLPVLRALAATAADLAAKLGDPAAAQTVADLNGQLDTMAASANLAAQEQARFKADLQTTVQSGFGTFLGQTITEVDNVGQAFVALFADIAKGIQRITADLLSAQITRGIFRLVGGIAAGAGGGGGFNEAGHGVDEALAFAHGGLVPGSGRGDTVPAMLTPGEGVLTTREVAALGGPGGFAEFRRVLTAGLILPPIRRSGVQHLNHGGLVSRAVDAASAAHTVDGLIRVQAEPGSRVVETDGEFLEKVHRNPRAIRQALGIRG